MRAGKLVALAVTDAKRSTFFPELPTMIEAGVPDCESVLWFGIAAPGGHAAADHRQAVARRQRGAQVGRRRQGAAGADGRAPWRHARGVPQAHGSRAQTLDRRRRERGPAEITLITSVRRETERVRASRHVTYPESAPGASVNCSDDRGVANLGDHARHHVVEIVAVEGPAAGIVGVKGNGHRAHRWHQHSIAHGACARRAV